MPGSWPLQPEEPAEQSCGWLQPLAQVPLRPAGIMGNMFNLSVMLGRFHSSIPVEDILHGNISAADRLRLDKLV